jgi:hypothetical protein
MAAEGVGKVLSAIPNAISHALSAAGHDDAANWIQDNITHNLANPAQIGDAVESSSDAGHGFRQGQPLHRKSGRRRGYRSCGGNRCRGRQARRRGSQGSGCRQGYSEDA